MKKLIIILSIFFMGIGNSFANHKICKESPPSLKDQQNVDDAIGLGINILRFGAISGDTLDDSFAIQCAVDAARTQGKTVFIPIGTFYLDNTINLIDTSYSQMSIAGANKTESILVHRNGDYAFKMGDGSTNSASFINFSNFRLQYGALLPADVLGGLHFNRSTRGYVDYLSISNYNDPTHVGIKYQNTWVHTISKTLFNDLGIGVQARVESGQSESIFAITITNSNMEGVAVGVDLRDSASVSVVENTIEGPDMVNAVNCESNCNALTISRNYFEASAASGSPVIFIGDSSRNQGIVIDSNLIDIANTDSMIEVRAAMGLSIRGNFMNKEPNAGGAFIKIGTGIAVRYFTITNNFSGEAGIPSGAADFANFDYVQFINQATGVKDVNTVPRIGFFLDNKSKDMLMGVDTQVVQMVDIP